MCRYREAHDFLHVLTSLPPTIPVRCSPALLPLSHHTGKGQSRALAFVTSESSGGLRRGQGMTKCGVTSAPGIVRMHAASSTLLECFGVAHLRASTFCERRRAEPLAKGRRVTDNPGRGPGPGTQTHLLWTHRVCAPAHPGMPGYACPWPGMLWPVRLKRLASRAQGELALKALEAAQARSCQSRILPESNPPANRTAMFLFCFCAILFWYPRGVMRVAMRTVRHFLSGF